MAAEVITTAVSLRKGDTDSNRAFVGVLGEVTVDLGNEANGVLGIDGNVTLRVHNGINQGGIPLARADTRNISTASLAENRDWFDDRNLAYADLSNIEETLDDEAIAKIVNTLSTYGIINTEQLNTELAKYALVDMSNVLTSTLATGRGRGENGNLAYADTTNINTADLTSNIIHDGTEEGNLPLAYANASNIDTTNLTLSEETRPNAMSGPTLARNDLVNISKEAWQSTLFNPENELFLEQTTNKDYEIPEDYNDIVPGNYPTSNAVYNYVDTTLQKRNYLYANIRNATSYLPLYSNNEYTYIYEKNTPAITKNEETSQLYAVYSLNTNTGYNVYINFIVTQVNEDTGFIEKLDVYNPFGSVNLNGTIFTIIRNEENVNEELKVTLNSEKISYNDISYQKYTVRSISGQMTGEINKILNPIEKKSVTAYLGIRVTELNENKISNFEILPSVGNNFLTQNTFNLTENISISIKSESLNQNDIGGAGLAKTDLSNLLGMDQFDQAEEENTPWRIRHLESIPNITKTILTSEYYNIANNGQVHDALVYTKNYIEQTSSIPNWKANTEYVITPYPSKVLYNGDIYYCITAHTSSTVFDTTNWKLLSEDTFEKLVNKNSNISLDTTSEIKYPTNKAVVDYVKEQIEAVHTPGHYYGQVNIFVDTENNLPSNSDPSAEYTIEPYEGLTALVQNYNNTNKPAIATYTNNAWTYKEVTLQNGVYVYVLDLGSSYHNGPGNATWNNEDKAFDIAPDKFQVPDGITLNLNDSTGAIQIVPALQTKLSYVDVDSSIQTTIDDIYSKLSNIDANLTAMVIPSPQFFTGTGIINQQLVLTDNVAFDLYVNGVFQYPNTYAFDTETKTITLNFAVENTSENGIAVIYRGFRTLQQ